MSPHEYDETKATPTDRRSEPRQPSKPKVTAMPRTNDEEEKAASEIKTQPLTAVQKAWVAHRKEQAGVGVATPHEPPPGWEPPGATKRRK